MNLSGYILSLILITSLSGSGFGAEYDAELAKKLGGDEMGMKQYVLVILKTGPNDANVQGKSVRKFLQDISRTSAVSRTKVSLRLQDPSERTTKVFGDSIFLT